MADDSARWLARSESRRMVGRGIAMVLASALFGAALIGSERADRTRGEKLTRERYEKDFESYRTKLIDSADTPALTLVIMLMFGTVAFAALEGAGIVIGMSVGAVDDALARRSAQRRDAVIDDTDD